MAVSFVEMTGDTDWTSGALLESPMSLTSVVESVALLDFVPVCEVVRPPLNTVKVLVPRLLIDLATASEDPVPTARRTMTAATPMSTPSMVSSDRSQLELMPRRAMTTFPIMFTTASPGHRVVQSPPVRGPRARLGRESELVGDRQRSLHPGGGPPGWHRPPHPPRG